MRYRHILWRIFFFIKRRMYELPSPFIRSMYLGGLKDIKVNRNYKSFPGVEKIKGIKAFKDEGMDGDKRGIARIIEDNEFCFLNKTISFHSNIDWQKKGLDRLWLYNLHYFDYGLELGIANIVEGGNVYFDTFKRLVMDWIDKNQEVGGGCGWDPYPLSLRIANWVYAYSLFEDKIRDDHGFEEDFLEGMAIQAAFLSRNIEYYVSRNHLIKNGKALFLAGCLFRGVNALRWRTKGRDILIEGTREQILSDGGHYERSPMYHLIVLQDYMETFILAKKNNIPFPVEDTLKKMLSFLANIIHPDNQIPLLNDSAFGIAREPGELFTLGCCLFNDLPDYTNLCKTTLYTILLTGMMAAQVTQADSPACLRMEVGMGSGHQLAPDNIPPAMYIPQRVGLFKDSGLCCIRSKDNDKFLVIGCKEPSPAHLPGHSHADILSYELSLGGRRFITDSGVSDYSGGRWRGYFRGTRAHNTVSVNGQDQSELWDIFGIARRAGPCSVRLVEDNGDIVLFEGSFKGFPRLGTISHQRHLFFVNDMFWVILDTIMGDDGDEHPYNIESFIHVHPEREVEIVKPHAWPGETGVHRQDMSELPGLNVVIHDGKWTLQVCPIEVFSGLSHKGSARIEVIRGDEAEIQGWYAPEFGKMVKNSVIVLSKRGRLPLHIGYCLFPSTGRLDSVSALCKIGSGCGSISNDAFSIEINIPDYCWLLKKEGTRVHLEGRAQKNKPLKG